MLRFTHKLPEIPYYVGVSGGPDSMGSLDFLSNHRIKPKVAFFNHGDQHSDEAEAFVRDYAGSKGLEFFVGRISHSRPKNESLEEHWRKSRLGFFHSLNGQVITGHNLNDVIEWWIISSLHGESKLLPYRNGNIIRPFRATLKLDLAAWCERNKVPYLHDPCNADTRFIRSHVRHKLMPEALIVNPGLRKVILKKVLEDAKTNLVGTAGSVLENPKEIGAF